MATVDCIRCGFEWDLVTIRKADNYCPSCRARRVRTVDHNGDKCHPWQGRFDVDMITPIDENGYPVKPGPRSCGNSDCMNAAHYQKD